MRLLIFGINYAPEPTGIGPYTADMAQWLAGRGHTVDVVTALPHYPAWCIDARYQGRSFFSESSRGVHVLRSPLYTPAGRAPRASDRILLETSFSASSLRYWWPTIAGRLRYDAVIAICPPLQMGVYPALYQRLRNVPWVFHIQDLQVDAAFRLGVLRQTVASRALYRLENLLLRQASCVSTITEAMRRRVIEKGVPPERTFLLPNWADLAHIFPQSGPNEMRMELGIREDDVVCMYSGTMGEKQGLEVILEAARALRDRPYIRFVLAGEGPRRRSLEAKAMDLDNVRFFPLQPRERLNELLAAADLHLVVQRRDAADLVMPSKLGNILAAGRAVIATADPGTALHDAVMESGAGRVVPPDDCRALADAVLSMATSRAALHVIGSNGRRWAEAHLCIHPLMAKFESKLVELVQKGTIKDQTYSRHHGIKSPRAETERSEPS